MKIISFCGIFVVTLMVLLGEKPSVMCGILKKVGGSVNKVKETVTSAPAKVSQNPVDAAANSGKNAADKTANTAEHVASEGKETAEKGLDIAEAAANATLAGLDAAGKAAITSMGDAIEKAFPFILSSELQSCANLIIKFVGLITGVGGQG